MPSTTKPTKPDAPAIDAKALMASIGKGWKLVNTPKVRSGFKAGQQKLVQSDGKTLGLLTLRDGKGVRVEGNRLAMNVTVTDAKGVTEARKLLTAVHQANAKAKPKATPAKGKSPEPTVADAAAGINPTTKARVAAAEANVKTSGQRARTRQTNHESSKVA